VSLLMPTWLGCVNALFRSGTGVCTSPKAHHTTTSESPLYMDVLPSPPELSSDIQRAIQQAVGQVNNAFITHEDIDQPRAAKRKRNKEKAITRDAQVVRDKNQLKPQSKKSKKATSKQSTQAVPDMGSVNESLVSSSGPPSQSRPPAVFIDTVVSAASATSAASESPYGFPHPCFDPPASSSYPYSTIPNGLSLSAPAFQPPISFSDAAIPGLEYASNDDILRALQDLDVTKVASVLKTLGDAAAAANISLTSLSSTLLQRPQPTTPVDSTPSNPVIAESPAQRVLQHHRRLVDIDTRQEPLEHSDHAELLATKWLSANKLAELARTQGQCRCPLGSRDLQFSLFVIGLLYKKGKFSAIEEQQLADAIKAYKEVGLVASEVKILLMAILHRRIRLTTRGFSILCLPKKGGRGTMRFGLPSVRASSPLRVHSLIVV
jgi:hypothetical protein